MAGHFSYRHLPAKGLGQSNPIRSTAVGGLGDGIAVFIPPITDILQQRIYVDMERALLGLDRSLLGSLTRELDAIGRVYVNESRFQQATNRIYADIDAAMDSIDRVLVDASRTQTSIDRSMKSISRHLD